MIICGPASTESVDKIDLGLERLHLRRRCTKVTIPITAKMAATPPMEPPTIAPMFLFCFLGDGKFVVVPLTVIVLLEALREGPSQ
jgi:hypothetical protein